MLIILNRIHPFPPAAVGLWLRPCSVWLQHPVESNDPWGHLDVNERDILPKEERACFVGSIDKLADLCLQLFCVLDLL